LHLLLRMWQVHLTTWKNNKYLHLHPPSKDKIRALASPPRSLATIHTTMVKQRSHRASVSNHYLGFYLNSPLHWIFDNSQIGGSSHQGDGSQGQ
jgi:hypothetical protein